MKNEERSHILKMIADGKITAEEGLTLLRALEETQQEEKRLEDPSARFTAEESTTNEPETGPTPARLREAARRLWHIPLWVGIIIVLLSGWGMYTLLATHHLNFWFYCLLAPFLLGVGLMALAVNSRTARWLVVDIRQKPGAKPGHIFFGFPLPLKCLAWGARTFGRNIPDAERANVSAAIEVLESGLPDDAPLLIHTGEDEDGTSVQVYLG